MARDKRVEVPVAFERNEEQSDDLSAENIFS